MGASLLLNADLALLHFFNGSSNMLLDQIVWLLSSGLTWVPPLSGFVLYCNEKQ